MSSTHIKVKKTQKKSKHQGGNEPNLGVPQPGINKNKKKQHEQLQKRMDDLLQEINNKNYMNGFVDNEYNKLNNKFLKLNINSNEKMNNLKLKNPQGNLSKKLFLKIMNGQLGKEWPTQQQKNHLTKMSGPTKITCDIKNIK